MATGYNYVLPNYREISFSAESIPVEKRKVGEIVPVPKSHTFIRNYRFSEIPKDRIDIRGRAPSGKDSVLITRL